MGCIPDKLGVRFPAGKSDFGHIQIALIPCGVYPPSYTMVIKALSQVLMWVGNEDCLNVVAQRQISAPAWNRTSLLLRVFKEQPVYHYRSKKKTDLFLHCDFLSKSEINSTKRIGYSYNIARPFENIFLF
jgi:hypothetical protein